MNEVDSKIACYEKVLSRTMMLVPFHELSLVNLDCKYRCFLFLLVVNEDYSLLKDDFGLRVDTDMLGDPIRLDIQSF